MNELTQVIIWFIASISALGVLFGGAGHLIAKYKGGSAAERAEGADIISSNEQIKAFYKQQNDDYKLIITEQNIKIEKLTREVGEIRGQLNAESKQKREYLDILQNRDPETKKFIEHVMRFTESQSLVNVEVVRVLKELHTMAMEEQNRNLKVTTTVTKGHEEKKI